VKPTANGLTELHCGMDRSHAAPGDDASSHQLLRPDIAMSWRRSAVAGLTPAHRITGPLTLEFDSSSRLLQAATPVLDSIRDSLQGVRAGGLLADASGTVVGRFFGDPDLATAADRFGGCVGMQFDESSTGTNAIATCIETKMPVNIVGNEHYLDCLKGYDCYGVPIINPVTRRLEGAVDLQVETGFDPQQRRALQVVLDRMVREISMRALSDYDPDVQQSLAAFNALTRRTTDPVVLFGRDFVLHNRRALSELSSLDLSELEHYAMSGGHPSEMNLVLESGREVAVQVANPTHGEPALLRVRNYEREHPPVPRSLGRTKSVSSRIDERADVLAFKRASVLVVGERGTGRTRIARRIAESQVITLAARDFESRCVDSPTVPLLIEDIQDLPSTSVGTVAALIRSGHRQVVITATPDAVADHEDKPTDITYLAGLCSEWIELPPLRERFEDLPQIFDAIARERTADSENRIRLTQPAIDQLRRHRWPGNIAELAAVLYDVATRRTSGEVTIADLPSRYQKNGARAHLTPFELAELDLIERTLDAYNGNKVHTANHLGISRSKLYARLRYFHVG
jgi:transcriptional regulator of acetoin/glycerol metabolism